MSENKLNVELTQQEYDTLMRSRERAKAKLAKQIKERVEGYTINFRLHSYSGHNRECYSGYGWIKFRFADVNIYDAYYVIDGNGSKTYYDTNNYYHKFEAFYYCKDFTPDLELPKTFEYNVTIFIPKKDYASQKHNIVRYLKLYYLSYIDTFISNIDKDIKSLNDLKILIREYQRDKMKDDFKLSLDKLIVEKK